MAEEITYENFFKTIHQYVNEREKEIQDGINDYNMVNVVRKENAEVGMHSNVIYSLINPTGLHYRGDLFLKLFIRDVLAIDDFGDILSVRAEESTTEATAKNRRIDFTIKSTEYYIGIEMKVDAADSPQQIDDYARDLLNKAREDRRQKVIMYYLTKDGKEAGEHSSKDVKVQKISFKEHILNWIINCQNEVKDIPKLNNLNLALENYKDIVKKITGQYKGRLMTLKDYLNPKDISEIKKVLDEIDNLQQNVTENFVVDLNNLLSNNFETKRANSSIDIQIGQFSVRLYFNISDNKLLLQITDKENCFTPISQENRAFFHEKYLVSIKRYNIQLSNLNWQIGYGELLIGKVRYQTQEEVMKNAKELVSKLFIILNK